MEEMIDRCMETMGSMMGSGMMGSGMMLVGLLVLLLLVLGIAALGVLGIWAFRRLRHNSTRA